MDNLKEMYRYLDKCNLPRLNQEKLEIMKNPIASIEIESAIENLPKNKSPTLNGFTGEPETFRE